MSEVGHNAGIDTDKFNVPANAAKWRALGENRITVWWALELAVREASFPPTIDVYMDNEGNRRWEVGDGKGLARKWVMDSFIAFCSEHSIVPRNPYSPLSKDFKGESWQSTFTISADEFERWLANYLAATSPGKACTEGVPVNQVQEEEGSAPKATDHESPAVAVKSSAAATQLPKGLPSSTIIRLFSSPDSGKMGRSEWKAAVNDPPKWLRRAKRKDGTRGNNAQEPLWCPLAIAEAMVWGGPGPQIKSRLLYTQVTRIFERSEELKPYREAWLALAPQREALG